MPTEKQWKILKRLIEAGWKPADLGKKFSFVTAQQIYNQKKKWAREDYYKDPQNALYHTEKYKAWRLAVFRRDNFSCRHCGRSGRHVRLEADHILPKSTHPHLMYKISNGRTLCRRCHRKTPTFGLKALNYRK